MKKNMIYTDLAIEASEMVHENNNVEVDGVIVDVDYNKEKDIKITSVNILNDEASVIMEKPKGKYITIESDKIKESDINKHKEISKILAHNLNKLVNLKNKDKDKNTSKDKMKNTNEGNDEDKKNITKKSNDKTRDMNILLVGLGNSNVTADSLGPRVINNIIVTRHLYIYMPNELDTNVFGKVSAIIPGVMGSTGMETSEIISGISQKTNPDLIIAIDSLAARNTNRINTTIPLTDTGIHPGSGVGNKRKVLNKESLNVPVIAIGVPTVVNALTLINDIGNFFEIKQDIEIPEDKYTEFAELCVTPKEEDIVIERIRNIITNGLNLYLHEGLNIEEIKDYMY